MASAWPSVRMAEAGPDWVGLTDAAQWLGVSRQNLRQLMLAHPDTFPTPTHSGSTLIWHLAELLDWLGDRAGQDKDPALAEVALVAWALNAQAEAQRRPKRSWPDLSA